MAFFKSKIFKPFKNIFVLALVAFAIWMLFFDTNSWVIHHELNTDIKALEDQKEYYKKEIKKDNRILKKLTTEEGLEKFAREEYYMKRDQEDIYIIEYEDSLKLKEHD